MATTGPPASPPVQPPIGYDRLTGANTHSWNGDIGVDVAYGSSLAENTVGYAGYRNSPGTLGIGDQGLLMTWATCVAGCAAAATGTLTGSVFVVGAGSAVAKAAIPANGYGWVKN